jgi:hypothetical protein
MESSARRCKGMPLVNVYRFLTQNFFKRGVDYGKGNHYFCSHTVTHPFRLGSGSGEHRDRLRVQKAG